MKTLPAHVVLLVALLVVTPLASAQQNASSPPAPTPLATMLCTQDGMNKGLKGKDLEEFVGRCIKVKAIGIEKNDAPVADDMANC